jgi:NAD(P)-dependent dehydrogenase (short-subunit alcohol dehydrogenase family)
MMLDSSRVAVITGATGGLGRAVVKLFARSGLRLALFSTSDAHLAQLTGELRLPANLTLTRGLNFREPDSAATAARLTVEKFGRADMLVHLIGGWAGGPPLADMEPSALEDMLQQHVWSTFRLAKAFVPVFASHHWGRMVVISTGSVRVPNPGGGLYAAAKAAQESLVLSVAQEYKSAGITANILRVQTIDEEHQRDLDPSPKNAGWTTPEEIASAVAFLCSEEASMLNGARIPLYGRP